MDLGGQTTDIEGVKVAILGINYSPEKSGVAPYTTRLARGLAERGHAVRVFTTFPHYPEWRFGRTPSWSEHELLNGVPVTRLGHYLPESPGGLHRALSEVSFGTRLGTTRWGAPEVVLAVNPALLATGVARLVRRLHHNPAFGVIVQDLYSVGLREQGREGLAVAALAAAEGVILRSADGVVVIHDRFARRITADLSVDPKRIATIRNWTHVFPAPTFDREAFRTSQGWGVDDVVVLHTGAMGVKQGLDLAVEAARRANATGLKLRFVFTGAGGQRAHLESLGAGLQNLTIRDAVPDGDYSRALASADVLLLHELPGVGEMAVPSKLTSYFSSGSPVLAAVDPEGIAADEVRAADAGVVIRSGNPDALNVAAADLGTRADAREIGARGRLYCETVLLESAALDAYSDFILRLHARRRA
jgi:colanic acid biosynthesis glycosyl transferase WcaI